MDNISGSQQPTPQFNDSPVVVSEEKPVSFVKNNIIAVVFIVLFIVTVTNQSEDLASLMFFVMIIMGFVAGGSFLSRMRKLTWDSTRASKTFSSFVGVVGAIVIFIVSFFAGVSGLLRNIQGD